jgi:hypothetical protein
VFRESDGSWHQLTFLSKSINSRHSRRSPRQQGFFVLGFAPLVRDGRVDHGRADVAMAEPVLDVGRVPTRIHEMDRDRVPQDVGVSAIGGQLRGVCVSAEETVHGRRR